MVQTVKSFRQVQEFAKSPSTILKVIKNLINTAEYCSMNKSRKQQLSEQFNCPEKPNYLFCKHLEDLSTLSNTKFPVLALLTICRCQIYLSLLLPRFLLPLDILSTCMYHVSCFFLISCVILPFIPNCCFMTLFLIRSLLEIRINLLIASISTTSLTSHQTTLKI